MMTMRATIERNNGVTDPHGQKSVDWQSHLDGVMCRVWAGVTTTRSRIAGRLIEDHREVVSDNPSGVFPLGTDITKRDRVVAVKDRVGSTLFDDVLYVDGVLRRRDHLAVRFRTYG